MNLESRTRWPSWSSLVVFAGLAGCQSTEGDLAGVAVDAALPPGRFDAAGALVIPPDASLAPAFDAGQVLAIDAGATPPPPTCSPTVSVLHPRPAEALLIQDRSTAMAEPLASGSTTKWTASSAAIASAVGPATAWGMMLFPKPSASGECCPMPTSDLSPEVEVPPGVASAAPINNLLAQTTATGTGRPIARAIVQGANYLAARTTSTGKYLVLIAAGEPTCASDALCSGANTADHTRTKDAVTRAASLLGIPVAVVAVGLASTNNSLQPGPVQQLFSDLAKAGGMPNTIPGQPPYYSADSASELAAALGAVGGQMRSCSFALATSLDAGASGEVTMSDVRIPQDPTHQDGWDLGDDRASVVLYGKACSAARAASEPVSIQFSTSCASSHPVI
jgi:hypothetical protein